MRLPIVCYFLFSALFFYLNVSNGENIKALTSFSVIADFVRVIGEPVVEVAMLVDTKTDPHTFRPTPGDVKKIQQAQIIFTNGLGLEGWLDRLFKSTNYQGPIVVCTKDINASDIKPKCHDHCIDPHCWNSIQQVKTYIKNIKEALIQHYPAHKMVFETNEKNYLDKLNALHTWALEQIAVIPKGQRKVITGHDAFSYLGRDYDIEFIAPQGISTETEATARDVAKVIEQIKKSGIKALFIEPKPFKDPRLIENIARETKTHIQGTLFADNLSPKDGVASTYLDMFKHNITSLVVGMKLNVYTEPQ